MHDAPPLSILVVEDNPDLAASIADYLEAKGHLVDVALDGVTGLHLAVAQPHDAIVLDLMLPGLDDLSVCRCSCSLPAPPWTTRSPASEKGPTSSA